MREDELPQRTAVLPVPGPGRSAYPSPTYSRFVRAVATAQLEAWLPLRRTRLLDLGSDGPTVATVCTARGHDVVRLGARPHPGMVGLDRPLAGGRPGRPGRLTMVRTAEADLSCVRDGSVDGLISDGPLLSRQLATEPVVAEIVRVLRPGGRVLLSVESLTGGMATLAEQSRWAELADVPSADVVLVPQRDGVMLRCFWPDSLRALATEAGLEVTAVLPRTVLAPATVENALAGDPGRLGALVRTETVLAGGHADAGSGRLVLLARKAG